MDLTQFQEIITKIDTPWVFIALVIGLWVVVISLIFRLIRWLTGWVIGLILGYFLWAWLSLYLYSNFTVWQPWHAWDYAWDLLYWTVHNGWDGVRALGGLLWQFWTRDFWTIVGGRLLYQLEHFYRTITGNV